ncbi:O-antigen polymerase [Stutzerimonas zhaodongensis]|uniref:O-antigen polymerase n=1 Tax=Stutzerimonas TaxID=2901164 RepID=UPI00388EDD6E
MKNVLVVLENQKLWIPSAVPFFLFGLIYYLITPYFSLLFLGDLPLVKAAGPYIGLDYFNFFYWLDVSLVLLFFLLGYELAKIIVRRKGIFVDGVSGFRLAPSIVLLMLFAFYILIFFKIRAAGGGMFSGYESYNIEVLGPLATLVFTSALFYNFFSRRKIKSMYFILFIVASLSLLGFGSRMFFVLSFIAMVLGSLSRNPFLFRNVYFYVLLSGAFLLVLGVGVWRSGYSFEDSAILVSIFFVEPLFTATSGALYLANLGGRLVLNFPVDIAAALINFIPSFIYPEKLQIINQITFDENKESPFGANALFSNLYSNFGMLYPIYIFCIGYFYGFLRVKSSWSPFFRAVYFSLLPLLMFHFFREGFITFIKVLIFNGVVFPFVLLFFVYLFFIKNDKEHASECQ